MTDTTQDPEQTPLSLIQRLRLEANDLTSTYVATDAHGDPIERPGDGSEEADFDNPEDPVEFEPEQLHDLAGLYREAATALEEAQAELASQAERLGQLHREATATRVSLCAVLGVAMTTDVPLLGRLAAERLGAGDPPSRAPLLAQLEALLTSEPTNLGPIREAIRVIRTEAQLREVTRAALKDWHGWARKLSRAEGDEYADAMRATLQARIAAQHESGRLAMLVEPVRRRVELVLALCADIGLGAEEAAELAPKAALWTDAEVAEIEAFRVRDWSGTGLNPFEHLPLALERTVYPGPGGRRAYLQRSGESLPPEAPAKAQLGLPGLPKPETALRLRLALIDKPDSPEAGLVAAFALAMLEELDAIHGSCDLPADYHPWMANDWVDEVRMQVRLHVQKGDPRDVAVYCAFAWHHGWSLAMPALKAIDFEAIEARFTEIHFLAEPNRVGLRFEGVPFDIRVPDADAKLLLRALHENFVNDKPDEAARKAEFFRSLHDGEVARRHHADLRHAMGHTARDKAPEPKDQQDIDAIHKVVTMLLTAEPALDIDCFPVDPATGKRQLEGEGGLEMAARLLRLAHERGAFDTGGSPTTRHWRQVALYLWHALAEIERLDPTDAELSKVQFRGEVRRLAAKRLDMFSAETFAKLDAVTQDKAE